MINKKEKKLYVFQLEIDIHQIIEDFEKKKSKVRKNGLDMER